MQTKWCRSKSSWKVDSKSAILTTLNWRKSLKNSRRVSLWSILMMIKQTTSIDWKQRSQLSKQKRYCLLIASIENGRKIQSSRLKWDLEKMDQEILEVKLNLKRRSMRTKNYKNSFLRLWVIWKSVWTSQKQNLKQFDQLFSEQWNKRTVKLKVWENE